MRPRVRDVWLPELIPTPARSVQLRFGPGQLLSWHPRAALVAVEVLNLVSPLVPQHMQSLKSWRVRAAHLSFFY